MADPLSALGAASASLSFGAFATKSVKALYDLIKRFHGYPDTVRHLKTELHGLLIVLDRVQKIQLEDSVLAELEPILKGCQIACSELQQVINRCTSRSGGNQPDFQDWAKMEFLGGSIGDLKETLAGYKSTITVIITSISIDLGHMTLQQLEDYQSAIADTNSHLLAQLRNVGQRSSNQAEEQEKIREVEDAILRCIQACRKARTTIERVQRESLHDPISGPEKSIATRRIWQVTEKDFEFARKFFLDSEAKLLRTKEQDLDHHQRREDQRFWLEHLNHCRSILEKRKEEVQQEKSLRFENISSKDHAIQVIRSTSGTPLWAKDINAEAQSFQILGNNPAAAIEKLAENHGSCRRENSEAPSRPLFGFFRRRRRNAL